MKTRAEAVEFAFKQFDGETPWSKNQRNGISRCWHYGRVEVQELMDFIYGSEASDASERMVQRLPVDAQRDKG